MGSYSASSSNTNYTNAPFTQEDVTNPINLVNSNLSQGNISVGGSLNISSDAQTVGQAFDFGSKLVQVVADLTKSNNAAKNEAAKDATKEAATGETAAGIAFDWTKYKTELLAGGALLLLWYFGGFKK